MVQLQSSPVSDAEAPAESVDHREDAHNGSPQAKSPHGSTALQLALNPSSTVYHGYETYISEGLICLKHKIRNIEKKKLKLEAYRMRLENGESLNPDQMDAVGRYEEVIHSLKFAKELHKTLGSLTQDLLRAQKRAVQQEQMQRADAERRRLSIMLQMHYVLCSLQRQDIRRNFCNSRHSNSLSMEELDNLLDLASLAGCKRNENTSLEEQMEQASSVYLNLLDGKEKTIVGSTYASLKAKLLRLVDSGFFDYIPSQKEVMNLNMAPSSTSCTVSAPPTLNGNLASRPFINRRPLPETHLPARGQDKEDELPPPNWKTDFLALKSREPPDSWDMEFSKTPLPVNSGLQKPWKGSAGFIPKTSVTLKSTAEPKQKRQKKNKENQRSKSDAEVVAPVEVYNSPSSLAKDPTLRRQQLDHLMDQMTGSFSFMQDSLLDLEGSPNNKSRALCLTPGPSPILQRERKLSTADVLPQAQHSTPVHSLLLSGESKPSLHGDRSLGASDLEHHTGDVSQVKQEDNFTSPPLYCRESLLSLPLENKDLKQPRKQSLLNGEVSPDALGQPFSTPPSRRSLSVFSTEVPMTRSSELNAEGDLLGSVRLSYSTANPLRFSTASTQTPPELSLPLDDLQMESAYISESDISSTSQAYSSPGQDSALQPSSTLVQHYYPRSSLRGGYDVHRINLRTPGVNFASKSQRESGAVLYNSKENGYQLNNKLCGGAARRHNSAGWSDSSQVDSPDSGRTFTVDSALCDPLDISATGMQDSVPPPHTLMPVYPQLRVAFSAARATNLAPGTLDQPIAFDLLHSNLGNAFDGPTGHFSCPVAGTYVFIFHILKLAISVPLYINLMRNDEVVASAYANDGAPDHETASNHTILPLQLGDDVWLRLHRGAIYGSTWKYSTFSGFLLYPD